MKRTSSFVAILPSLLVACSHQGVVYTNPPDPNFVPTSAPASTPVVEPSVVPSKENNWGNSAACPKDLSALREASCDPASKLTCQYEECMGDPAVTATCDAETKKWKEDWMSCNPPPPPPPKHYNPPPPKSK